MRGNVPIHQGPAPAPARSISVGDQIADVGTVIENANLLPHIGPSDLTAPPPLPRGMRSAPAPENPQYAADFAELRQQIGQLTQSIGSMRDDYESRLEEQKLNHEAQLLSMRAPSQVQLPPGLDPAQNVTLGDLTNVLTDYGNTFHAAMLRQLWDVTPDEEMAVLTANPSLATLPEPQKTNLIKRAVELRRGRNRPAAPTAPASTQAPGSSASPSAPQNFRQAVAPVPMVESNAPGDVGDLQPQSTYQAAIAEYKEADRIPDRTRRLAAKKAAMKKAQYALGITDEALAKSAFQQVSTL